MNSNKSFKTPVMLLIACIAPPVFVAAASPAAALPRIGTLILQIAFILLATRISRDCNKNLAMPLIMNDLLVGAIIGPYFLGGIHIKNVFNGVFPRLDGPLPVSNELYLCAILGATILLFALGLETDLELFIRYSLMGVFIGLGGALLSFIAGMLAASLFLKTTITAAPCLFMGLLAAITSVGISSRALQRQKFMNSPEGVSSLAAAGADNILGILLLVVVNTVAALSAGENGLAVVGGRVALWLAALTIALLSSKYIADLLNMTRLSLDLSLLALGLALLISAIFDGLGLPLITGAYIIGLSLSRSRLAPVIQERIHGIYELFVPICFAVMGMMVKPAALFSAPVLSFTLVSTALFALAKLAGCGLPALAIGFNIKGALRIGSLMISRGELSIIIACLALAAGAFDERLFAAAILICLITSCLSPLLLRLSLRYFGGSSTRKHVKGDDISAAVWEFYTPEIASLVADTLLGNLKAGGFFVQQINLDDDISQARKDSIALSISRQESTVSIATSKVDMGFVRASVHKVILDLRAAVQKLVISSDPSGAARPENRESAEQLLSLIKWEHIVLALKGDTKAAVLAELVDTLATRGKLRNRDAVLDAVLARERIMSTGMLHGLALPHARSEGINDLQVAIGIKKSGVDFESIDGEKARLFVLVVSPKARDSQHVPFIAAISAVLKDSATRERVINAVNQEEALALLQGKKG
ncbi:MAG: cation:proton antiporter [Treponema sp.]|jgi:Kef-type K+ transport system membrane component KefB/mannitol/fructose-specific phosphotransferase system IIA component (Ntr-type)|nr:cation:proton antiporter [Treponema sp.]